MTSVPKPLKFLRPFYGELIGLWEGWEKGATGGAGGLLSSVTAGLLGGKEGELVEERVSVWRARDIQTSIWFDAVDAMAWIGLQFKGSLIAALIEPALKSNALFPFHSPFSHRSSLS